MKGQKLDNKTLDAAGRKLVLAAAKPSAEVERVVANPYLFNKIKARAAEMSVEETTNPVSVGIFETIWRYRTAVAGAFVVLIVFGVFALTRSNRVSPPGVAISKAPAVNTALELPPPSTSRDEIVDIKADRKRTDDFQVEKAVLKRPVVKAPLPSKKAPAKNPDAQFYAVSYAGDPAENDGGHIVRVELPRSSLFAMGINVPLENDSDAPVKADLLIGRDGATRAIRVVK